MSSSVEFELNINGLRELMKSSAMQSQLEAAGKSVAAAAGSEYGTRVHTASYVAICNVYPASKKAAEENYEDNTLLQGLGSAGLSMR